MKSLEQLLGGADLRHPCDLDLLLFFDRHPAVLMTSEQLAAFVGYDVSQVAKSLDLLVGHQFLLLSHTPTHCARLYRFKADHGGDVREVLRAAATVEARRQMRGVLGRRPSRPHTAPPPSAGNGFAHHESAHA